MLATVIRTDIAVDVSIKIMDAFNAMRKFLKSNGSIFERLTSVEYKLIDHDKKFEEVFNQFHIKDNVKQKIFFDGQIYDAYNLIVKIIKKADDKILIIDNYIDESVLELIKLKI